MNDTGTPPPASSPTKLPSPTKPPASGRSSHYTLTPRMSLTHSQHVPTKKTFKNFLKTGFLELFGDVGGAKTCADVFNINVCFVYLILLFFGSRACQNPIVENTVKDMNDISSFL